MSAEEKEPGSISLEASISKYNEWAARLNAAKATFVMEQEGAGARLELNHPDVQFSLGKIAMLEELTSDYAAFLITESALEAGELDKLLGRQE